MNRINRTLFVTLLGAALCGACLTAPAQTPAPVLLAQAGGGDDNDLKIAALEALMAAPPRRALPTLQKVLAGRHDDSVKAKALFVLSQIDLPEAEALLLQIARDERSALRLEAVRTIGIGGSREALAALEPLYREGDATLRQRVLEAYLIAQDADAVYRIAANARTDEEFDEAAQVLGAMRAKAQLSQLRDSGRRSESLIHAYAVAGDVDSLSAIARDGSDPALQAAAIRGLGIVGSDAARTQLRSAYRAAADEAAREAALNGLLIAGDETGVLELFRASTDEAEKRRLLRVLVMMDSDAVMDVIDAALEESR